MKKNQKLVNLLNVISLQCRGADGNLEKDVGVVIRYNSDGSKVINCPHYDEDHECILNIAERYSPPRKCVFEK